MEDICQPGEAIYECDWEIISVNQNADFIIFDAVFYPRTYCCITYRQLQKPDATPWTCSATLTYLFFGINLLCSTREMQKKPRRVPKDHERGIFGTNAR